ncbi:MAG: hypothetical protein JST30_06945 [Armatimonadetes bacterium]|nr:hypothetical protein [Armatimonadota bacterium]
MTVADKSTMPIVSLTYDGTQLCHSETALADLERYGIKATFYADPVPLLDGLPTWRDACRSGHEVGNGCLSASVSEAGLLGAWTVDMLTDDITETDALIREVLPLQQSFSIAFPWATGHSDAIGDVRSAVAGHHVVCRSGVPGLNAMDDPELAYLKCVHMQDLQGRDIVEIVRAGVRSRCWTILAFDGVGSGDRSVDGKAHRELCTWLSDNADLAKVATVRDAARSFVDSPRGLRLA